MSAPTTQPPEGDRADYDDLCPWCGRSTCDCYLSIEREAREWLEVAT